MLSGVSSVVGSKICLTRRCSVILVVTVLMGIYLFSTDMAQAKKDAKSFDLKPVKREPSNGLYPTLSYPVSRTVKKDAKSIDLNLVKGEPSYGLDFTLSYTVSRTVKKRTKKKPERKSAQSYGEECDRTVTLKRIDEVSSINNGLFMMETSGRGTLKTRQACGVESAAVRSGLSVHLLMFSPELDLRDNTTCQLYMSNNNIQFFYVDVAALAKNTPLDGFFDDSRLKKSRYRPGHTADALRLLIVYKYGGFYLDLDYVVFNDLTHYNNIVVGNRPNSGITKGIISLTNNAFKLTAQHPLLSAAMRRVKQSYDPNCWICIGPMLITDTARQLAGTKLVNGIPTSADFSFVTMKTIMSVHFAEVDTLLFPERPVGFSRWKRLFAHSSAVHLFSKTTSLLTSHDDPRYSAYAVLGPRYCPFSYYSSHEF